MERSKYTIVIILIFCFTGSKASYKSDIYNAYISNNMTKWVNVIDEMHLKKNKSNEFLMELVNYQYGYIAWCIGVEKDDLAKKYLGLAEKNLEILEKANYKLSLVNSYKSAFYGYKIGLNKVKAPFYGPKSVEFAELAMKQDKNNPFGFIQYGNAQYFMPAVFGGSKTLALEYFKKAEKLMELASYERKEDWNYLNLLTLIGQAYTETNNLELAKAYYEKILKIEPNYSWVKTELYPQLLKKIKNTK